MQKNSVVKEHNTKAHVYRTMDFGPAPAPIRCGFAPIPIAPTFAQKMRKMPQALTVDNYLAMHATMKICFAPASRLQEFQKKVMVYSFVTPDLEGILSAA